MNLFLAPATILGSLAGGALRAAAGIGLSAVSGWVVAGSVAMLDEVVKAIGLVTTPSFTASWFSGTYWRVSALAMLLTLPFLFAAAVQAIVRTDLGVLFRAALVDLPIAAIGVTVAAPLITLLLAATDEMCSLVTDGGSAGGSFLTATAMALSRDQGGFLLMIVAVVILVAGMLLMIELIIRSAAIYVVVLFLPLGFAAMVWPARRIWIKRMTELLVALILSKFAMVAILSLAVAGLSSLSLDPSSLTSALSAMALMLMACLSPWALLRLLPFTELAAGAHSTLRQDLRQGVRDLKDLTHPDGAARQIGTGMIDPVPDTLRYLSQSSGDDPSTGHGQPGHGREAARETVTAEPGPGAGSIASGGNGPTLAGAGTADALAPDASSGPPTAAAPVPTDPTPPPEPIVPEGVIFPEPGEDGDVDFPMPTHGGLLRSLRRTQGRSDAGPDS